MADLIRIGKVSTIDYAKGTVSVVYIDRDNAISPHFPMLNFAYEMPKINDMVIILLLANSNSKGFVLGSSWNDVTLPPESGEGIFIKIFSDGTYVKYDANTKKMEVSAQSLDITGDLNVENISVTGNITCNSLKANQATIQNLTVTGTAFGHFPE